MPILAAVSAKIEPIEFLLKIQDAAFYFKPKLHFATLIRGIKAFL